MGFDTRRASFRLKRSNPLLHRDTGKQALITKPAHPPLHTHVQWASDDEYGWYSDTDDSESDDETQCGSPSSSSSTASVEDVIRREVAMSEDADDSVCSGGDDVILQAMNKRFVVSTKCFGSATPFTWAVGGFRIVRRPGGGQHAEYRLVTSWGTHVWAKWIRFSAFTRFVDVVRHHPHFGKTLAVWSRIKREQRLWRCLDTSYLKLKSVMLEDFLRQALFDATSPASLLYLIGEEM